MLSDETIAVTVAVKRPARSNPPGRSRWSELVVRGRVELPTFRFSGGLPNPYESTTGRLTRPDALRLPRRSRINRTFPQPLLARR